MPPKPTKKYKLKDCLGLDWEKRVRDPDYFCDFCGGPCYTNGYWVGNTTRTSITFIACQQCGSEAGLEW